MTILNVNVTDTIGSFVQKIQKIAKFVRIVFEKIQRKLEVFLTGVAGRAPPIFSYSIKGGSIT